MRLSYKSPHKAGVSSAGLNWKPPYSAAPPSSPLKILLYSQLIL